MKRLLFSMWALCLITIGCSKQEQPNNALPSKPLIELQKVALEENHLSREGFRMPGVVYSWTPQLKEKAKQLVGQEVGCITRYTPEVHHLSLIFPPKLELLEIQPWNVYEEHLRKVEVTEEDITRLCARVVHDGKTYYLTSHTSVLLVQLPVQGERMEVPVHIGHFLPLRR